MFRFAFQATVLVTAAATSFAAEAERKWAPLVSQGGVVNAAGFATDQEVSAAPGSIIAIFGVELAAFARAAGADDLVGSELPKVLGGVEVQIHGLAAPLYYVSPHQVNCQIPLELRPRSAPYDLRVVHNNEASPAFPLRVGPAAPGLFPVVTHQDFSLVGRGEGLRPAVAGELVVLFGAGFGQMVFPFESGQIIHRPAPLILPARVFLDDVPVAPERVPYVGASPGFAGLYQVNLLLPEDLTGPEVEVHVEIDGLRTPNGLLFAVDPAGEQPLLRE